MKAGKGTQKVGFKNPSAVRIFGRDFARTRSEDFQSNGTLKQVYTMKECPGVKVYKERRVLKEAVTGRRLGISYTITVAKNGSRPATFVQSVTTDINSARAIEAKVKALAKSRNR